MEWDQLIMTINDINNIVIIIDTSRNVALVAVVATAGRQTVIIMDINAVATTVILMPNR
jgi:hypothetical protein